MILVNIFFENQNNIFYYMPRRDAQQKSNNLPSAENFKIVDTSYTDATRKQQLCFVFRNFCPKRDNTLNSDFKLL